MDIEIKEPGKNGCNCPLEAGDPEKNGTRCILGLDLHDKGFFSRGHPGPNCPGPGVHKLVPKEEARLLRELAEAAESASKAHINLYETYTSKEAREHAVYLDGQAQDEYRFALIRLREWKRSKEEPNAKKA